LKRAFGDVSIDFFLMQVLVPRSVPRPVLIALLVTGAVSVFTIGSVLCSLSTWLWSFIAARVLQGTGGAAGGTAFQRKA
jgi:MFS family permease